MNRKSVSFISASKGVLAVYSWKKLEAIFDGMPEVSPDEFRHEDFGLPMSVIVCKRPDGRDLIAVCAIDDQGKRFISFNFRKVPNGISDGSHSHRGWENN